MIADSLIVPECIYRPGSFTGLMTLYESNYIKLSQLVPDFDSLPIGQSEVTVSCSDVDHDLHLQVRLRERYTITLKLTYLFYPNVSGAQAQSPIPDPDLTVRVYQDARLAEAVRVRDRHQHHKFQELARAHCRELDWRWRNNMMLNKWLDYLLEMGHGFAARPVK